MTTSTANDRYVRSAAAHERACRVMPGGVSSPVRAFKAVGREPITVISGKGAQMTDIDGNTYIDYVMSYGPLILGHAPDVVLAALSKTANKGTSFGMTTEHETALAWCIVEVMPTIEQIRFVNSGTEACMSAIRLARAATGCYHGHSDALLVQAGSGATTLGMPSSPGVPQSITANTLLLPYNDLAAAEQALAEHGGDVAAILVEPIAGNMGCIPPAQGYLAGLRQLCDQHEALLIFDEVMTGFRVHIGGAQTLYDVRPDLTCLGKIVGGGLPCAAYGGRAALMAQVAPQGPVYQAGTLSGNPLAMAAGLATLQTLADPQEHCYENLEKTGETLAAGLRDAAAKANVPVQITRVGSMLCVFFVNDANTTITNYEQATQCRTDRFAAFFNTMLDQGVMLPPSQYEAWFISTAHDDDAVTKTIAAAQAAFQSVANT